MNINAFQILIIILIILIKIILKESEIEVKEINGKNIDYNNNRKNFLKYRIISNKKKII